MGFFLRGILRAMRILRPRTALCLALVALACTGGTFTCSGSSNHDDDNHDNDKIVVNDTVVKT